MAKSSKVKSYRPTDITKELQRRLKEINERYELAARATNDVIYDLNLRKATVTWSEALYTQYGYHKQPETNVLEWWVEHIHPDDALRVEDEITDWLTSSKDTWQTEYRFQCADGTYKEVRDRGFLVRNTKGEPLRIIGSLLDITQQKRLDRAKDEFISLVSHQLRTPLTVIRIYSDMFTNGYFGTLSLQQQEHAQRIGDASVRLIELVQDMLSLSRLELGRIALAAEKTNINHLIQLYIDELLPLAHEKGAVIEFEPDTTVTPLHLDATIYGQVIRNYLENAVRYAPLQGGRIQISFRRNDEGYLLRVHDNGIGVPSADLPHVFERFYRAENSSSADPNGTGLGLYLVKLIIVDTYTGKVWCESTPAEGTTFYALLPFAVTELLAETPLIHDS